MKRGPDQIALPLDWPQDEGDSRFIVSDANRPAFEHFRQWSLWPVKATILIGPRREFVAQRDGVLFLGVNEGDLADNTGSYDIVIEAEAIGR